MYAPKVYCANKSSQGFKVIKQIHFGNKVVSPKNIAYNIQTYCKMMTSVTRSTSSKCLNNLMVTNV